MSGDLGFRFTTRKNGDIVIQRSGTTILTLRGRPAARFLDRVSTGDAQQVMARVTGNYKRGNERN